MRTPTPLGWPAGIRSALALTFDLDGPTMWTSRDPRSAQRPGVMSLGEYDVGEGLASVLDWLDGNGLSSTFFVPSDVAASYPDSVVEIARRGHDIGCHGTDHVPVDIDVTRDQELDLIRRATDVLEDVAGRRPSCYRAPMYGVTGNTWSILDELGYRCSSNLMDSIHPYVHDNGIVEAPVHWSLDDGLYFLVSYHPANYRVPRSSREVTDIWLEELTATSERGGVTTLTLHPQLIGRPSRLRILQDVLDAAIDLGGVWFPRLSDLGDHGREVSLDTSTHARQPS